MPHVSTTIAIPVQLTLGELRSQDHEAIITYLFQLKLARYPADDRIIVKCGVTAENNVHVEWRLREPQGKNDGRL